ncbi:MAG: thioredoxin family protein [Nitrospira sp.]|nr:thioredoxin family protein [Nitrospira sp.]
MRIDCYMSLKCGAEADLRYNISRALALEGIEAQVNFYRVTDEEANSIGLMGSPSVLIDGKDIQPMNVMGFS